MASIATGIYIPSTAEILKLVLVRSIVKAEPEDSNPPGGGPSAAAKVYSPSWNGMLPVEKGPI
jgi:hypothetical protein